MKVNSILESEINNSILEREINKRYKEDYFQCFLYSVSKISVYVWHVIIICMTKSIFKSKFTQFHLIAMMNPRRNRKLNKNVLNGHDHKSFKVFNLKYC